MHVKANGIDIHCRFDGPEGAPLVTLSNSLGTNLAMWDPQLPALTGRYRVLRYDTRGHGKTSAPAGPYTVELLAEDAAALLAALKIKRTHFCGLSLGGMIGQVLGARHGGLVHGLVLCDTACQRPAHQRAAYGERIKLVEEKGMAALVPSTLERWFTAPYRKARPEVTEKVAEMIRTTPVPGYVGCARAIEALDIAYTHAAIKAPTLVIVGADDPSTTVAMAEEIHRGIKGSKLHVIKSAAHLSNVEQPEAFNDALLGFLNRL